MALLYFKDEKMEGKQWMGKAAVRKLLGDRDEELAKLRGYVKTLEDSTLIVKSLSMSYKDEAEMWRKRCKLLIGGFVGYQILLAIVWGCAHIAK